MQVNRHRIPPSLPPSTPAQPPTTSSVQSSSGPELEEHQQSSSFSYEGKSSDYMELFPSLENTCRIPRR
eukprot:c7504_g1_i1 orf=3-206(-)